LRLELRHPLSDATLGWEAEPPEDFAALLDLLREEA
jgi:hypothetical protein